jgi:hypothetical protein
VVAEEPLAAEGGPLAAPEDEARPATAAVVPARPVVEVKASPVATGALALLASGWRVGPSAM